MSIQLEIERLLEKELLFCLESQLTGEDTARTLFVTPEILEAVTPPYPGERPLVCAEFREFLDGFLENGHFSVAEDPDLKPAYAMIARVKPPEDEFWSFRVIAPNDSIRGFGGFAALNTFVLLTWEFRDRIFDFDAEVARCREEWRELFGAVSPFKGNQLDEYLTTYTAV